MTLNGETGGVNSCRSRKPRWFTDDGPACDRGEVDSIRPISDWTVWRSALTADAR